MPNFHQKELLSSLSNLFGSSKYSDLTVQCGSDLYKVHRAVVCQRSDFFAAACDSGFREAIISTITLEDDEPSTVRRMLTYLYTLNYDDGDVSQATAVAGSQDTDGHVADPSSKSEEVDESAMFHSQRMNNVRVYALAEKYNISALKELAKTKFTKCIKASEFTQDREVFKEIFESTPDTDTGLHDIIIQKCANASNVEKSLEEEGLAPVIRDHGNFGLGMLREVVKEHHSQLQKQKQVTETRTIKLKEALSSLHNDAVRLRIPGKMDSWDDFECCWVAFATLQQKISDIRDSVKLQD